MNQEYTVELTKHALERAKKRLKKIYVKENVVNINGWLIKIATKALKEGKKYHGGLIFYSGICFVFSYSLADKVAILTTVMSEGQGRNNGRNFPKQHYYKKKYNCRTFYSM